MSNYKFLRFFFSRYFPFVISSLYSRISLDFFDFPIFQILHFFFHFSGQFLSSFFVRSLPLFSSNGSLVRRFDFFSKSSFDISTKIQLESSSFQSIPKIFFSYFLSSKSILEIFMKKKYFCLKKISKKVFSVFIRNQTQKNM